MNTVNIQSFSSFKGHEKARRYAMQALYGWQVANNDIKDVEKFYRADRNPKNYDVDYFIRLLHAIAESSTTLDTELTAYLDRTFASLDPIELTILRIAIYEFKHSFDVPFRVIIHEAVELARVFGAQDSYKFINSVLDKMAKDLRSNEIEAPLEACSNV
jgi:N utilization substance protein B